MKTREEFQKNITYDFDNMDKGLYICPKCGAEVRRDYSVMYCVHPPKYKYFCVGRECDYKEIF